MKKLLFWLSSLTSVLFFYGYGSAQERKNPTPALNFLRIEPDAKGSGLGLTGAATEPDNFSIFYNPGKLAMMPAYEYGISAGYVPWISRLVKGIGLASAQGFRRLDEYSAIGLDIRFFSMGKIDFKDELGYDIYSYTPAEFAIGITYSLMLSDYAAIGASLRYINSRPALGVTYGGEEIKSANAIGGDVGYYYCSVPTGEIENYLGGIFRGGISLQNLGSKVRFLSSGDAAFQPMNLKVGIAYTLPSFNGEHFLTISADANKMLVPPEPVRDASGNIIEGKDPAEITVPAAFFESWKYAQSVGAGFGAEYSYKNTFFLRAGAYYEPPDFSPRQLATVGAGLRKGMFHLDLSYFAGLGKAAGSNNQAQTFKISLGMNMIRQ